MSEGEIIYKAQGQLGIIALQSAMDIGKKIDIHLKNRRSKKEHFSSTAYLPDSFIIPINEIRFSNGEGKVTLSDSVRGRDVYIICDIGNYSCKYKMFGETTIKGPDEHFQDIKRAISCMQGKSKRITVIMPLLYASRQHRRKGRESLECALALQELERMGINNILTFDVHDPNIQNAVPLASFENVYPTYDIVKSIIEDNENLKIDKNNMIVISPDTGAMDRAIYYSNVLKLDVGMFYKRRDHSKIVDGKNPIVQHEYIGSSVKNKTVLIVDDIIASGESVLDIAYQLKKLGASRILVAATFALFNDGIQKIQEAYEAGFINKIYSTNLTYVSPTVKAEPWYKEVDLSEFLAKIIDYLNYNRSIATLIDATYGIQKLMKKRDRQNF